MGLQTRHVRADLPDYSNSLIPQFYNPEAVPKQIVHLSISIISRTKFKSHKSDTGQKKSFDIHAASGTKTRQPCPVDRETMGQNNDRLCSVDRGAPHPMLCSLHHTTRPRGAEHPRWPSGSSKCSCWASLNSSLEAPPLSTGPRITTQHTIATCKELGKPTCNTIVSWNATQCKAMTLDSRPLQLSCVRNLFIFHWTKHKFDSRVLNSSNFFQ